MDSSKRERERERDVTQTNDATTVLFSGKTTGSEISVKVSTGISFRRKVPPVIINDDLTVLQCINEVLKSYG